MSLFLNTSSLHNLYLDCSTRDVSETIERDCLSVLHKLHDQVNGLQLVQVVVQPLARLFNPASLAALVAASPTVSSSPTTTATLTATLTSSPSTSVNTNLTNSPATSTTHSNATTPSSINRQFPGQQQQQQDLDGSTTSSANISSSSNHSRAASFVSSFNPINSSSNSNNASNNNTLLSSTSTYMMSPDTAQALIARLDTDRDVNWLMEIIGYGLSMPFSLTGEQDSVKDCCTIYCEWLSAALLPYNDQNEDTKYQQLSKLVPAPIRMDPNRYARKMLSHLYNVFLPRQVSPTNYTTTNSSNVNNNTNQKEQIDANLTAVSRQAVLCHRVLRTIENIAQNGTNLMDNQTWDHLLALLLTVNDKLLSAPTEPDDIGTQLHDRILGVLFDLMLLASAKSIPNTSLWKTFHEMSLNWRHRPALVDHWRRITLLLTKRVVLLPTLSKNVLHDSSNVDRSTFNFNSNPIEAAIAIMNYEILSQTWFRFLNLIGNPVELTDPNIISRTDEFYHSACASDNVLDPRQHPCLNVLPQIFLNSMAGLKDFIEAFLGKHQSAEDKSSKDGTASGGSSKFGSSQIQQHLQPRPSLSSLTSRTGPTQHVTTHFELLPERPKCNSILHVFGNWLFNAALIGSDLNQQVSDVDDGTSLSEGGGSSFCSSSTTTEVSGNKSFSPSMSKKQISQVKSQISMNRRNSQTKLNQPNKISGTTSEKMTLEPPLSPDSFESGQAEAMAILCRIFSSKTSSEDISPIYLSRFYLCLQHCLVSGSGQNEQKQQSGLNTTNSIKRQLLASVLINSTTILQKDLDGINLLVPSFIKAIEFVFDCNEREIPVQPPPRQHSRSGSVRSSNTSMSNNVTNYDLRRACILTLVNLLSYPFHFRDLVIRNCLNDSSPTTTFGSLRTRLLKLLFVALQTETDPTNMQILFGGLSLAIHDLASNTNSLAKLSKKERINARKKSESTNSAGNNSDSTNNSLDSSGRADDTTSQSSFVFDSSGGFLVKSLHVTCHLLINIWKHDTQVSLAALELLTTIARVSTLPKLDDSQDCLQVNPSRMMNNNNLIEMRNEYKQTTKWICDYICNQCSRPPPAHSRDMHSTIVAAYQCLSIWFYNHSYLLNDDSCINTVMEVIELGVCGQKSKNIDVNSTTGVTNLSIISKGDKIMKPSSMRVREAAELLLNTCMIRARISGDIGHKITSSYDTVLDEQAIAEIAAQLPLSNFHKKDSESENGAYRLFKYFSDEDSIIFALLDDSSHDIFNRDSVLCLLRTPFGKHCWRMKFVYYTDQSREKIMSNKTLGLIKRPFQQVSTPTYETRIFSLPGSGHNKSIYFNNTARFFPDTIEKLPINDLDKLVTTLEDYTGSGVKDQRLKKDLDQISKILTHQILAEQKVLSEYSIRIKRVDCEEPQPLNDFEASRILLTHLGLRTSLKSLTNDDRISDSFVNDLKSLDQQSVRICDSVNIFYVRKNRTTPKEILESVRDRHNVSLAFFQWILELGRPIVVKHHGRWTGKQSRSWDSRSVLTNTANQNRESSVQESSASLSRNQMLTSDHGGAIFDGERMTLYWSDMCQELAFLVPHKLEKIGDVNIIICWLECSDDILDIPVDVLLSPPSSEPSSVSDDGNFTTDSNSTSHGSRTKPRDYAKYFISTLKNGLYRVNLITSFGRNWLALPLVDGMTVSKGILSCLIRESVLNLCRRRRLDADSYQPPHVRRRLKIQDICNNYKISSRYESTEFYNNLFKGKSSA